MLYAMLPSLHGLDPAACTIWVSVTEDLQGASLWLMPTMPNWLVVWSSRAGVGSQSGRCGRIA